MASLVRVLSFFGRGLFSLLDTRPSFALGGFG